MVRVLKFCCAATLWACTANAEEPGSRIGGEVGLDFSLVHASGYESWTDGSVGKLRYSDSGFYVSRAFVDLDARLADTLEASIVIESYYDGLGSSVDLTEAYLQWRPVPQSANRFGIRVGTFYPRMSLENVEHGWTNPYLVNSSAINTWAGEELRLTGAELSWSRKPTRPGGRHEFRLDAAVFWGNDPSGTLMAWKGWSIHDRQTRFSDELPLPDLPALGPDGVFRNQDPHTEPIREIDHAHGIQVGAEWRYANRFLARAMHYKNKADPVAVENGQYGWYTEFDHVGVQASLPGGMGLITQWLSGTTVWGPNIGGLHPVDIEFEGYFVLLTRPWGRNRISVRYDKFDVIDNDFVAIDDNSESGHGWTAGYRFSVSDVLTLTAEYLGIKTRRPAFEYFGLAPSVTEEQVQLTLQLRF